MPLLLPLSSNMSPNYLSEQYRSTASVHDESALSDTEEPFEHEHDHDHSDRDSTFNHIIDGIARRLSVEAAAGPASLYSSRRSGSFTSNRSRQRSLSSHHHTSAQPRNDRSSFNSHRSWVHVQEPPLYRLHSVTPSALSRNRTKEEYLPRIDSEKSVARTASDLSSKGSTVETDESSTAPSEPNSSSPPEPPPQAAIKNDPENAAPTLDYGESVPELSTTRKVILGIVVMLCLFVSVSKTTMITR